MPSASLRRAFALTVIVSTGGSVPSAPGNLAHQSEGLFRTARAGAPNEEGRSRGIAWGDYDGDGRPDLFVSRLDPPAGLYHNTQAGFQPAPGLLRFPGDTVPALESAGWIDLDGDGDLDLYGVSRNAGRAFAFENLGNDGFELRDRAPLLMTGASVSMVCWADIDRDADLDAFVVAYRGSVNRFLRNDGAWTFTAIDPPAEALGNGITRACAWGDIDGDGLPDLLIGNAQAPNVLLHNRGSWRFAAVRNAHLDSHIGYSYGVSWADYDADGDLDLFVANFDRENILYENRSGALNTVSAGGALTTDREASKGHTWGDFDLDGDIDLYIANGTPAPNMHNTYYFNDGTGRFERSPAGPATADADTSAGAAAADYDGDGDLDLVVGNWGSPGARTRVYENRSARHAWTAVRLTGVASNRFGVGGHIRLFAHIGGSPRQLHRWILANTGYASQDALEAHFGIGDASRVDSLIIHWPNGATDVHRDLPARTRWTATEGGAISETR